MGGGGWDSFLLFAFFLQLKLKRILENEEVW
jgi:hypothetical protein